MKALLLAAAFTLIATAATAGCMNCGFSSPPVQLSNPCPNNNCGNSSGNIQPPMPLLEEQSMAPDSADLERAIYESVDTDVEDAFADGSLWGESVEVRGCETIVTLTGMPVTSCHTQDRKLTHNPVEVTFSLGHGQVTSQEGWCHQNGKLMQVDFVEINETCTIMGLNIDKTVKIYR